MLHRKNDQFYRMKKIFYFLKMLTVGLTWKMFRTLISKPLLILPTIWATIQSVMYAEFNFQEAHGGNGIANAFRHAAWNLLIAKNSSFFTSDEKAVEWAKFVTDMHEECFPNEPFDHHMDLHNNAIGRKIFLELKSKGVVKTREMIAYLVKFSETGVGLTQVEEMSNHPENLVYYREK